MPHSHELAKEREALEEMLRSEGWAVFRRRVLEEWAGSGYFARMGTAIAGDDPLAPKVVHRASLELQRMLQWPIDRVQTLKGRAE
jgi:hypothetical protein